MKKKPLTVITPNGEGFAFYDYWDSGIHYIHVLHHGGLENSGLGTALYESEDVSVVRYESSQLKTKRGKPL